LSKFKVTRFFSDPNHSVEECVEASSLMEVVEMYDKMDGEYDSLLEFLESRNVFISKRARGFSVEPGCLEEEV